MASIWTEAGEAAHQQNTDGGWGYKATCNAWRLFAENQHPTAAAAGDTGANGRIALIPPFDATQGQGKPRL